MDTAGQIDAHIAAQPEPKRGDMRTLHRILLDAMPGCRLWFLDGRDDSGRTVSNPNIGYGSQAIRRADGKARDFYQVGMSANTTGISIYIMGLEDRTSLPGRYAGRIGKASVTGYCIKFRALRDIDVDVLVEAVRYGIGQPDPA